MAVGIALNAAEELSKMGINAEVKTFRYLVFIYSVDNTGIIKYKWFYYKLIITEFKTGN